MCYNCGCKKPNETHGIGKAVVNQTFRDAAEAFWNVVRGHGPERARAYQY